MKICVIGLGYIGLPTAAVLASKGIDVIGVDTNVAVLSSIDDGVVDSIEPGLSNLLSNAKKGKRLRCSPTPEEADVFIISVQTPLTSENHADLFAVEKSLNELGRVLKKDDLIILESTCPVGTTEKIAKWLNKIRPDLRLPVFGATGQNADVNIAYCPERVLPGDIIKELTENDRIIGGITSRCAIRAKQIYELFVNGTCSITDSRTAEFCKLAENSFRDVNIAFANELSIVCDKLDIDVWRLIEFANRHPRVNIMKPGPGVGGHCVAVDPWFIVEAAPTDTRLIKTARRVNDEKTKFVLRKFNQAVANTGREPSNLSIACFGLSFKPDVSDLRGSPALRIASEIVKDGFREILFVDPNIEKLPIELEGKNHRLISSTEALKEADLFVLLVDHKEFRNLNIDSYRDKGIVDTRGIWIKTT